MKKKVAATVSSLVLAACLFGCASEAQETVENSVDEGFSEEVADEIVVEEEIEEESEAETEEVVVVHEEDGAREATEEDYYVEETYYEPAYSAPSYTAPSGGSGTLNSYDGINYYNGNKETYYSSNVLYHYMTPQWTLREDGVWTDSEGYVVVASSDLSYGSTVDTSLGMGKVYDSGCASGVVDVYTAW